jgi:hypothetical protein
MHAGAQIGLTPVWQLLVPLSLDGAALYAALLALRAILAGDSAIWPRFLTCTYAVASAGFNAYQASTGLAAWFYGLMSLSAVVLWDTTLRALRRDQLRALGHMQGASARFRPLRWLLAPTETGQAWRGAVLEDIPDPKTALAVVRGEIEPRRSSNASFVVGVSKNTGAPVVLADNPCELGELVSGSSRRGRGLMVGTKADAVRAAFDSIGRRDIPGALVWLAERGITVDRSYAYTVRWTPALRAVGGMTGDD